MSLFAREKRTASLASTLKAVGLDTRASGHDPVTTESAQRVAAVWGCGRLLADTIATMPWDALRMSSADRRPVDPKPSLLSSPDGGSPIAWKRKAVWSMVLRGNAYGLITETTPDMRHPTRIVPVHPDSVHWRTSDGKYLPHIGGKAHRVWPLGDLWHLPAYELPGTPVGMNPIEYAATVINLGKGAQEFADDFFESDAHPSAMVTSKTALTAEQAQGIKDASKRAVENRDLLVLGSDLTWAQLSVSPTDSQFLDSMRFSAQQICGAIFGVPPEMLGFSTSGQSVTYVNSSDRDLSFLKYGVSPWLARLEEALSALLPGAQTVKFNTGGLLRADIKSRYETYSIAADIESKTGKSLLTVDEMRDFENLPGSALKADRFTPKGAPVAP